MKPNEMSDEELVRAVAEEVMGWELRTACTYRQKGNDELLYYPLTLQVIDAYTFDPRHRADHWMMVVERMRELGWSCKIYIFRLAGTSSEVKFIHQDERFGRAMNSTLGRAVLEAALSAVRGKEGENV